MNLPINNQQLAWFPTLGYGFLPVHPNGTYDKFYFDKYIHYDQTELGKNLLQSRLRLVDKYAPIPEEVVDVGCCTGTFVKARWPWTYGYDVMERSRDALGAAWLNPWHTKVQYMTFWDSLEHIFDPIPLLRNATHGVFISMPVYRCVEHVLNSKHYRPGEHYWYFTADGLKEWMREQGFRCEYHDNPETKLGREDIDTFYFARE